MAWSTAGASANASSYVLRSMLPGAFLAEMIHTDQENAMAGLKLQIQLFFFVKGDNSSEGETTFCMPCP